MDITWNGVPGGSTSFQAKNETWRLSMSSTALSLKYLGCTEGFFRVLVMVDSVPFSFHRHFPEDPDILIADSFSTRHTVSVKIRPGRQAARYNGIFNPGNACQVNSVLQILFNISEFRHHVYTENQGTLLSDLFIDIETEQQPVTPSQLLISSQDDMHRDARLFFLRTLDETGSDLFSGAFTIISQADCGCETHVSELFQDISLDVYDTLEDSLRAFLTKENIEQYECKEHGPSKAKRRFTVEKWPDVLALTLKRPEPQKDGPKKYCKYPFFISFDMLPSYKLYAVMVYENMAEKAHYFCYVLLSGRWTKFNDSNVTYLNDFEAFEFGGNHPVTGEAMRFAARMLFYVKESEWEHVFHGDEGVLTRIATNSHPRLRLDATPARFLTPSINSCPETVTESYSQVSSTSEYLSRLVDAFSTDENMDPGLSFYFSISDMPRYTALKLFSNEYPSVKLRPIKNDFLSKIEMKLWLPRKPGFFALFRVTEDKTERINGSMRANGDTFFCVGTDAEPSGAEDNKRRLYFLKRYEPITACKYLFPRSLVLSGYVFAGDCDLDAVEHFRVEGEEIRKVERKDAEEENGTLNPLKGEYEIVIDGIYVVLANNHQDYFRFRQWVRERKCLGGVFVERTTRIGSLESIVRDVFMSRGVSVDWKNSVVRTGSGTLESESAMETARSQPSVSEISEDMCADAVEKLCVRVNESHRTVYVGQGPDNYNEIDHIHSVVVRGDATVESLARKLKRCECLNLNDEFSFVRSQKDSFELVVMSRNERIFYKESLIVLQNLGKGRFNKVIFTVDGDPYGYPFFLCTEGLQRFGSICTRYNAVSLIVRRGPLLVVVDDDDEMGDEMLLVEISA